MGIINWIKGKLKQREVRNLLPDEEFQFKENFYGYTNILEGFRFTYCNNYTDKFYYENKNKISFISCMIILPNNTKTLNDILDFIFINSYFKFSDLYNYDNIIYKKDDEYITLYIRGDISYYDELCDKVHNNIVSRYIRTNMFSYLDDTPIETPNEFLENMYNSITNPDKEVDILFIEDNIQYHKIKPVIGLSIKKNIDKINLDNKIYYEMNNRNIVYCSIDKFTEDELEYIKNTARHGNKLPESLHISIDTDIDFDDVDEIIED